MSRSKHSQKKSERFSEDRDERRSPKGPKTDEQSGRERNVGHPEAEEHNRDTRGRRKK